MKRKKIIMETDRKRYNERQREREKSRERGEEERKISI